MKRRPCTVQTLHHSTPARAARLAVSARLARLARVTVADVMLGVPNRERDTLRTMLLAAVIGTEPCPVAAVSKLGKLAGQLEIRHPQVAGEVERVFGRAS